MSILGSNGVLRTAGSKLRIYGALCPSVGGSVTLECRKEFIRCTKVVLPDPAIPMVTMTMGFFDEVPEVPLGPA